MNDIIKPVKRAKSLENLKPIETLSNDEAKARGHSGGVKSGEARREKKKAKELAIMLAEMPVKGKNKAALMEMGYAEDDCVRLALQLAALERRVLTTGDPAAIKLYLEIAGQPPVSKSEVGTYEVRKIEDFEE